MRIRDLQWKHRTIKGEAAEWWESDVFDCSVEPMRGGFSSWVAGVEQKNFPTKEEAMKYCQRRFEQEVMKCLV